MLVLWSYAGGWFCWLNSGEIDLSGLSETMGNRSDSNGEPSGCCKIAFNRAFISRGTQQGGNRSCWGGGGRSFERGSRGRFVDKVARPVGAVVVVGVV